MKVFIIGGTSGIGLALADFYYKTGWKVGVCGRNLDKIASENRFEKYCVDVADKNLLISTLQNFSTEKPLYLLINCAGSYAEDIANKISYQEAEQMLKTNILGTINALEAGREVFKNRIGHIVLLASVSGILDYPKASLYAKTKRSVIQISNAYRRALSPFGISITTIASGYVDTQKLRDLNQNNLSRKPFLISEQVAVNEITKAINQKKEIHIFPRKMKWLVQFLAILPSFILDVIMYKKAQWMQQK